MHHLICIESDQYLPSNVSRIISVLPHVAVPQPSDKIFRIDFTEDLDEVRVKWLGTLPNKCKLIKNRLNLKMYSNNDYCLFIRSGPVNKSSEIYRRKIINRFGAYQTNKGFGRRMEEVSVKFI